jgi:DNA-directed RNA polymerase specialized sigma24 family protein
MVCGCVLSNYHRKQRRIKQFEQLGLTAYNDGKRQVQDAASNTTKPAPDTLPQALVLYEEAVDDFVSFLLQQPQQGREAQLAVEVLPYVTERTTRSSIAQQLGVSLASVARAISYLRKTAKTWQASL